jgi:hypothetical protein
MAISGLDLFSCELLNQIPLAAQTEDESSPAHARLYSSPTAGSESCIEEDWKNYVEPELRQLFQSAMEVVREDLAKFRPPSKNEAHTLLIPVAHLQSWINALNQARVALGALHSVTEEDMERLPIEGDARALALFQIHFYGLLQEYFLREVGEL